jgi:hypothetical protein
MRERAAGRPCRLMEHAGIAGIVPRCVQIVVVLGASGYTSAQAPSTQSLPDWIGAHVYALRAIGGAPNAIVSDNLKAGVTAACRYEPGVNRTYQELAGHYGTAILPPQPRKPRDKAKVEAAVLIPDQVEDRALRVRRIAQSALLLVVELSALIREILAVLNAKIMRRPGVSRNELLAQIDWPALRTLQGGAVPIRPTGSDAARRPWLHSRRG